MEPIVIIGGGVIGSSTAYHLALAGLADAVTVLEPDPSYALAATPKSTGGVRIQFSVPENIRMSQFGHAFYGTFADRMAIDGEAPDIGLVRRGYLYLSRGRDHVQTLEANQRVQAAEGAHVELLDAAAVKTRFPSIEVDDVDVGAFSPHDAIIDPHAALMGFRRKASSLGVRYLSERAVGLETRGRRVRTVVLGSGARLHPRWVVNAANCWAPPLCEMAGMKVPVAPLQRLTFYFECRATLEPMPLTRHLRLDGSFRPEGRGYITGYTPYGGATGFRWTIDHDVFERILWPSLARRVKAFEAIRAVRAWACHYDQNALDQNLIIGPWPGHVDNFLLACGLSGHGLQHAPAIGRALTELIVHGRYRTLDLGRFGYQRVIEGRPLAETGPIS